MGERKFRIGVLGSGKGSNFVAIADACLAGKIPAEVAVVLSDVGEAGILARARERKIRAEFLAPGQFRTKLDDAAEGAYLKALAEARRLHPGLSVGWVENWHPIVHAKDRAIYIEGLRAAGLA